MLTSHRHAYTTLYHDENVKSGTMKDQSRQTQPMILSNHREKGHHRLDYLASEHWCDKSCKVANELTAPGRALAGHCTVGTCSELVYAEAPSS